jgi:transcription initiation factor TFIIB
MAETVNIIIKLKRRRKTPPESSAFETTSNLSVRKITQMEETKMSKSIQPDDSPIVIIPLHIENAQSASPCSLITAPEGGVLNVQMCKIKRSAAKPPPSKFRKNQNMESGKDAEMTEINIPEPPPPPPENYGNLFMMQNMNNAKTQKKKRIMTVSEKSKLWAIFDTDKEIMVASDETNSIGGAAAEQDLCILCRSPMMIMDIGYPTCTSAKCGWICRDTLDYSPEWRFYGADDKNANDPTRCGNPINPLLIESSFGCKVLCTNNSSYEMKKIRKWTEWQSMPHKEKSLYDEFQFITVMAQNAGIPKIFIDYAMIIHKDISEQKMFRGMNRDGIKAASIYISCRLNGCPRTAHEIAEVFKLDKTSATNGCSMAVNILYNIERNVDPELKTELCTTMPSAFIDRYCSRLNFNNELTMVAKFVANKVEQNNIITDNIPHAIACGILYFVAHNCNLTTSKSDIKHVCGVSEVTINKCFKKLEAWKSILIPKCILDKYEE